MFYSNQDEKVYNYDILRLFILKLLLINFIYNKTVVFLEQFMLMNSYMNSVICKYILNDERFYMLCILKGNLWKE